MLTYFPGWPWLVLLVEPLHGITFALFYTAGVVGAKARMPSDRQTLAQGLFSAAFNGGAGVGAALGGLGVRRVGYRNTFLVFTAGFVVATVAAFVKLVDDVREFGGDVKIFSSMHVSGEQLDQLTGLCAILRYSLCPFHVEAGLHYIPCREICSSPDAQRDWEN